MRDNVKYEFHHFGIPVQDCNKNGVFSEKVGMYTTDNPDRFRVQWHRVTEDSALHPLIKSIPHIAFRVDCLAEAIKDEDILLGPYEPIDVPIELIQASLTDEELWLRARTGKGSLYREDTQK